MKKYRILIIVAVLTIFSLLYLVYSNYMSSKIEITFYNATPKDLFSDEYIVDEVPVFTQNDIKYFDWEQQTIMLKNDNDLNLKAFLIGEHNNQTLSSFATTQRDKFIVYVEDEFVYSGYYSQAMISSFYAHGVTMKDIDGGVSIENIGLDSEFSDERLNDKLYKALKSNNLLSK